MKAFLIEQTDMFSIEAAKANIQIFDVDHTITERSTGVRMGQAGVKRNYVSRLTIMQFPLHYMRYRAGSFNLENLPKKLKEFEGISKETLEKWGQITFDEYIEADIFPQALALIKHLKAQGKKIILCTSSLGFIIKPLADYLEVDEAICTELRFDEKGICTGEIVGLPAFGEGKVFKMKAYMDEHKLNLEDTAFYSDSINDLPLLKQVKYPVPTNPDRLLRKSIKANNWRYLEFRKR